MIDFSSAGLWDGIKKAGKVALWVAGSGAVTALIAELSKYDVTKQDVWVAVLIMLANSILAGVSKWLGTNTITN